MVTMNLDRIFDPKSIAVIGASDEEGTVGHVLMKNLIDHKFSGKIFPVNIRKSEIMGLKTYASVDQIQESVDLAVVATPARTVPEVVEQCGKSGILGLVIMAFTFVGTWTYAEESLPAEPAKNKWEFDIMPYFSHPLNRAVTSGSL